MWASPNQPFTSLETGPLLLLALQLRSEQRHEHGSPYLFAPSVLVQSFPLLRNEAGLAGLLGILVGEGKPRQQAASFVLLPWGESLLWDAWQTVCLGPTYSSGEGFLGRISTQGGKGRLLTIPVALGTSGKLLGSGA